MTCEFSAVGRQLVPFFFLKSLCSFVSDILCLFSNVETRSIALRKIKPKPQQQIRYKRLTQTPGKAEVLFYYRPINTNYF